MNLKDIALFKRFITDNAVMQIFINKYNGEKGSIKNPATIEDYLCNVDVEQVIPKAFRRFKINSAFGSDFWYTLNQNWLVFHSRMSVSDSYNDSYSLSRLEGVFAVLRENWNTYTPWRYEPVDTARVRYGLIPEEPKPEPEEVPEEEQPLIEFSDEEEDDPLADFDFFDDVLPRNYRLKPNEVSINFNNSNKITFNQFESKTIRESGLKFARLARNKVGDICLIINNREGVNISNLAGKANNQNTTINSVNICGKLRNLFHLKPDYSVLSIEKLQTTQEFIIYKITKQ